MWKRLIDFFLKYIAWYQLNCTFKRNCNLRILLVILAQFWCKGNVASVFMIHKKFSCTYKHWRLSSFSQIHFGWRTVLRWTSTRCHFRNRNRWATTNQDYCRKMRGIYHKLQIFLVTYLCSWIIDNKKGQSINQYFQIDMGDIKEKYQERFEKSLREAVENDCGGDFRRMLVALIGD